ncbi:MAG TPA: alpha/beta fold hydrolase [Gaiellaceae bacterium]|nr:alpha/beta fold hydrolase [Gaiellaceae bacterium]
MTGPTVVLLHAMPLDARMWAGIKPGLEEAGYPVVAPDLPGSRAGVGLDRWAALVLDLVAGPFVPVGSSMGGYLAFELWRAAPERIPALVLVGTRATADAPEQRAARDASIRTVEEAGAEGLWESLAPNVLAPDADPAVVARARELARAQAPAHLVATLRTLRDRPDSTPALPTIDVPVLVVVGEDDAVTPPAEAEAMVEAIAGARLVRVPGAGHLVPLERPDAVGEALRAFLAEAVR